MAGHQQNKGAKLTFGNTVGAKLVPTAKISTTNLGLAEGSMGISQLFRSLLNQNESFGNSGAQVFDWN